MATLTNWQRNDGSGLVYVSVADEVTAGLMGVEGSKVKGEGAELGDSCLWVCQQ